MIVLILFRVYLMNLPAECINLLGKYNYIQESWKHAILKGILSIPLIKDIARIFDERISTD